MRIAIIGGGIGGMTLALALNDAGFTNIDLFESAPEISELGVGINILPHAVRELAELGLLPPLENAAVPTAELLFYSKHGQRIWREPRGLEAGYNWPQFSIHRGKLIKVLYRAVLKRLGTESIHTGHHLTDFGQNTEGAWADFTDRRDNSARGRFHADLLVACDGIHSTVRAKFFPQEGAAKWNGIIMWRGISEQTPFLSGRSMIMAGHFRRRVVVYPISEPEGASGKAQINWVAEYGTADAQPMPRQDWVHTADAQEAVRPFTRFNLDFLAVPALIRCASTIYKYPMVDRDPLPTWNFRRITLLGDAAHPMYPVGSNGASQAIIDARVLARELAIQPTINEAVASYDGDRRPSTTKIVYANRGGGPEQCMEIVEQRAPEGFSDLADVISPAELEGIAAKYKRTAGFDPVTLNSRPSLSVHDPQRKAN